MKKFHQFIWSHNYQILCNKSMFCVIKWNHFKVKLWLETHLTHPLHTNVPPPGMAGRAVDNSAAVAVEKVLPSGHAVQLAGILACHGKQSTLSPFIWDAKASPFILTIIREPLVAFPLEICAIKLGALVLTEIFVSLGTVLGRNNTIRRKHFAAKNWRFTQKNTLFFTQKRWNDIFGKWIFSFALCV